MMVTGHWSVPSFTAVYGQDNVYCLHHLQGKAVMVAQQYFVENNLTTKCVVYKPFDYIDNDPLHWKDIYFFSMAG